MIDLLENAKMVTALDCQNHLLLNVAEITPSPTINLGVVTTSDRRLDDKRSVPAGSVTNASVAATAGIVQSKLSLNGNIPVAWLGTDSDQAAQGDLVQLKSQKDQLNGFCGLDSNGRVDVSKLPATGPQTGTVTSVSLSGLGVFGLEGGSPIITSGTLILGWGSVPDNSWLGVDNTVTPVFVTGEMPVSLIPDLDATKFTSGVFPQSMLPVAKPMGGGHSAGIVPEPGPQSSGADATDYLARDMTYKMFSVAAYRPQVPNVNIALLSPPSSGSASSQVVVRSFLPGSSLFYRINSNTFMEFVGVLGSSDPNFTVTLTVGDRIDAYAAKAGYNNSLISSYTLSP